MIHLCLLCSSIWICFLNKSWQLNGYYVTLCCCKLLLCKTDLHFKIGVQFFVIFLWILSQSRKEIVSYCFSSHFVGIYKLHIIRWCYLDTMKGWLGLSSAFSCWVKFVNQLAVETTLKAKKMFYMIVARSASILLIWKKTWHSWRDRDSNPGYTDCIKIHWTNYKSCLLSIVFKNWPFKASFSFNFRLFKFQYSWLLTFNLNLANDWIWNADLWSRKWPLYQLRHNHCPSTFTCFFKKWDNPGPFYRLFSVFSNKHHYKFYNKLRWKMSIQYTVPGFEPSEHESPPITTRSGLVYHDLFNFY